MKLLEYKGSPLYLIEVKGQLGFISIQLAASLGIDSNCISGFIRKNKQAFILEIDYCVLVGGEVVELKGYLSQYNVHINSRGILFIVFLEGLKKYYSMVPERINNEFIKFLVNNKILLNSDMKIEEMNNLEGNYPLTTSQFKLAGDMLEILKELELPVILKFKYISNILAGKQLDNDTYNKILNCLGEQ